MKFGKKYEDRIPDWMSWNLWWAWYPVRLDDGRMAWMETVERQKLHRGSSFYQYQEHNP